jgi:hypothetical protein
VAKSGPDDNPASPTGLKGLLDDPLPPECAALVTTWRVQGSTDRDIEADLIKQVELEGGLDKIKQALDQNHPALFVARPLLILLYIAAERLEVRKAEAAAEQREIDRSLDDAIEAAMNLARPATDADIDAVLTKQWKARPPEKPNLPLTEVKEHWREWFEAEGLTVERKQVIARFYAHPEMHGEPGKRNRPR